MVGLCWVEGLIMSGVQPPMISKDSRGGTSGGKALAELAVNPLKFALELHRRHLAAPHLGQDLGERSGDRRQLRRLDYGMAVVVGQRLNKPAVGMKQRSFGAS